MRWRAVWALILVACSSGNAPEASEPPRLPSGPSSNASAEGAVPSSRTPERGGGGVDLTGEWRSPSCGTRSYPRELELLASGRFVARDLISPCPAGASCVWSGIVVHSGRFRVDGARLGLVVEKGDAGPGGVPLPESLAIEGGAPAEPGCAYVRR